MFITMNGLYEIIGMLLITAIINYFLPLKWSRRMVVFVQAVAVGLAVHLFLQVQANGPINYVLGGWKTGVGITLMLDQLSAPLLLLTEVLFAFFMVFAYKKKYTNHLFIFLFISLQAMISGFFVSGDLFNLFILVEVSTITVSVLIMYKRDGQAIYDGLIYLLVNIVSGMLFLFGIGFTYKLLGTVDLNLMQQAVKSVPNPRVLILPFAFLMTSVCLKSAMMPLFSWLPKAHGTPSAPSIVSAVLSGLYVKNGLYLFLRLSHIFQPAIDCSLFFMITGCITAFVGVIFAIGQTDIKLILAYHTISQVGLIMFAVNMGNESAYWGGVYHMINHALFKSVLFLTAGMLIEAYDTRNVYEIRGVLKRAPAVGIAMMLAILGITGAPFFNGSISKYFITKGATTPFLTVILFLINLGTIVSFVKYGSMLLPDKPVKQIKVPMNQVVIILVIGVSCLASGLWGEQFIHGLFGRNDHISLAAYLKKIPSYVGSVVVGMVLYRFVIKGNPFIKRLGGLDLGFNGICVSIFSFLGVLLLVTHLVV
jgi:multicomponent Na+:H+ antiporter subunit D